MSGDNSHSRVKEVSSFSTLEELGYNFGKKIGSGSYGKVISATYYNWRRNETIKLACKFINKAKTEEMYAEKFVSREIQIMKTLHHPNIIDVHSIHQNKEGIFIFMKYAEKGDLLDYVRINGPLTEKLSKLWFYQMSSAVQYLHVRNIAHRDLKCENILISGNKNIKLGDFGFARRCVDENNMKIMSSTFCGSSGNLNFQILKFFFDSHLKSQIKFKKRNFHFSLFSSRDCVRQTV